METLDSLARSQQPAAVPCPEPNKSGSQSHRCLKPLTQNQLENKFKANDFQKKKLNSRIWWL